MGMPSPVSRRIVLCLLAVASFAAPAAEEPTPPPAQTKPAVEEPVATITDAPMEIISTARLPQAPVSPSRIPAAVQVIESADLSRAGAGIPQAIASKIPGASLSDEQVDSYVSGTETLEDGWRDATQSRLSRLFSKLGYRAGGTDLTLSYQHASTRIAQAGSLPVSILDRNRSANYTPGDFFSPLLDVVTLNARRRLSDSVTLSANGFGRWLSVEQFNVNFLTDDSRLFSRTATQGATLELEGTGPIFGRPNLLSAGIEGSHSEVNVNVFNERNAQSAPCESAADCAARQLDTSVHDRQDTLAAYVQDNLELGRALLRDEDQIFLTVAARWDLIRHRRRGRRESSCRTSDGRAARASRRACARGYRACSRPPSPIHSRGRRSKRTCS